MSNAVSKQVISMLSMNFSERIKLAMREADDMSQAELARQAGVTRAAVVHWMRCEDVSYPMKGEALLDAAKALRVSPYWLYRGEGPMRVSMVDPETRQLLDAFQRLPQKAKLTAVAQTKELADLISEKVNSVTAEKSGTIGSRNDAKRESKQSAIGSGVTSLDEAVREAQSIFGGEGASHKTKKGNGS